ncbi:polymorphic toxin-type HINT domain-containing protein, partial [Mycobacteroides abscessus]|uniref:polymorphic toxin-type HINT domain-containing protein n=1 Tax=Mycobacteroides abscessus TaxID=36809 RepID=UPI0009A629A7
MKALAVLAVAALPLSVVQPSASRPVLSATEQFAQSAAKAFGTSELGPELAGDAVLPPAQRSAEIPADTAAGWDLPTTDGRTVQLVPPGGLASGQITSAGQVVYSDAGAGYDVLAENTAIGKRMVTRISGPEKTRTVTMFVRTPADTVMLAHTNGFLTVNQATPEAETVAMFAPSEVRDSKGSLVASAYITQQLQPNLYLLSQVISPDSSTAWPVYADPFGIDIPNPITAAKNAVTAVASAGEQFVTKAVEVAAPAVKTFAAMNQQLASQAWSGIKTGANYVKENPLEFAQIVGGTALVASGVGSGFGASLIVSGASGLVNKAAEANPDNKWLQAAAVATEAATYIGPGGITKKGLQEAASLAKTGVEKLAPKLTTKADDAAKAVVPTPPTKLADDIPASVGKAPEVPANPAAAPKAPNAPPASAREVPCTGQSFTPDTRVVLADGTTKAISTITASDLVLATDPATGVTAPQPVSGVWVNHDTDLLDLTITNSGGQTAVVHTTAGHPFYRDNTTAGAVTGLAAKTGAPVRGWTNAADLRAGDRLTTATGSTPATVVNARVVTGQADMWDLTVENTHTFHLATPAGNVLVHNCTIPKAAPGEPKGGIYVVKNPQGQDVYVGRANDIERRIGEHLRAGDKIQPGDTVHVVHRTDNYAAQRGLEQHEIRERGTLNRDRDDNLIRPGVSGEFFRWEGWARGIEVIEA